MINEDLFHRKTCSIFAVDKENLKNTKYDPESSFFTKVRKPASDEKVFRQIDKETLGVIICLFDVFVVITLMIFATCLKRS